MSEMFNSLSDDIFLQDNKNSENELDNNKIDIVMKKYMESNASILDKKTFLKLRNEYFRIKGIDNYQMLQDKMYVSKTKRDIILFEISRILKNVNLDSKVLVQVKDIEKLLSLCNGNITEELYSKIVNLIIKIEISLGMKIGLFMELCCFFESEIDRIDKESVVDNSIYVKKKINGE